ncbi:MAG: hypothetical protein JWR59_1564 [Brevundimonas sp.]|nr:hypothetical protein [Brevundimonas sp.]
MSFEGAAMMLAGGRAPDLSETGSEGMIVIYAIATILVIAALGMVRFLWSWSTLAAAVYFQPPARARASSLASRVSPLISASTMARTTAGVSEEAVRTSPPCARNGARTCISQPSF